MQQSDEFQATGQYYLKMPRVYTNHPIKTALMFSNFIELMYNLHYYMIILQYITWYTRRLPHHEKCSYFKLTLVIKHRPPPTPPQKQTEFLLILFTSVYCDKNFCVCLCCRYMQSLLGPILFTLISSQMVGSTWYFFPSIR